MKVSAYLGLGIAISLAGSAISAAVFVGSGAYDIGAGGHHTKLSSCPLICQEFNR
jgi:hypothetical protein